MSPIRVLTCFMIILVAGSVGAQVDGYTCTNAYLDCGDVVESEDYSLRLYTTTGWPGDTIWLPVGIGATSDTIAAFAIFIDWDSTYLSPLTDPSDSTIVQHRRFGLFESVLGDFFAVLTPNPADDGAIAAFYNLSVPSTPSVMPPGDYGVMFSVGFVVKPEAGPGASSVFGFHQVNEYFVTDSTLMEAFCADCRRTNLAVKYDCEFEIFDTVSTDPLIIDTLVDTATCFSVRYPATTEGNFTMPQAEGGRVYLSSVDGLIDGTIPIMAGPVTWHFAYQNYDATQLVKVTPNGMVLYGSGGVTWTGTHGAEFLFDPIVNYSTWSEYEFSWDGAGGDTVGFHGGVYNTYDLGLPPGYHGPGVYVTVDIDNDPSFAGETFCVDSAFFPPSGNWKWTYTGTVSYFPSWDGPHCYELSLLTPPLEWVVAPDSFSGYYTDPVVLDYEAFSSETSVLTFTNEGAIGAVTTTGNNTCQFTYQPTVADTGATLVAVLGVSDGVNPMVTTETILTFTTPPPVWVDPPVSYSGDRCDLVVLDYEAFSSETPVLTFSNEGEFGTVTTTGDNTCQFTYQPTLANIGTRVAVIGASDGLNPVVTTETQLHISSQDVGFSSGCHQWIEMGMGTTRCVTVTVHDEGCDPITVDIWHINPTPVGDVYLTDNGDNSWTLCFDSDSPGDGGVMYIVGIGVTNGLQSQGCHTFFDVNLVEPIEVQIEKTHDAYQGQHELVDVTLNLGSEEWGGFDLLMAYDASALALQSAIPGPAFYDPAPDGCGWEYFNFRHGPFGNCGNACPSGLVRVFGLAETNNGPNHPDCFLPDSLPATLFSMDFLVSNDRTLECMYVPVQFFWTDCGDNSISSVDGEVLFVSDHVYDFEGTDITDSTFGFPTYFGVQPECLNPDPDKPTPIQFVDFYNGGIDIVCADSIDDRGDINLNGVVNEVADAVLYSNYFVHGLLVFNVNIEGQIAASDVNADGITLSVADLVYQIRIITGDAPPYPKIGVEAATYAIENGVMSVDTRMAAAFVELEGKVNPTLLAMNMEMSYAFDGMNTRVLVTKIERGAGFDGDFLAFDANIVRVEFATYDGAPVNTKPMPSDYRLFQNYPNPFNPKTTISFGLAHGGDYSLSIYNVTGQKVASFEGTSDPGTVSIDWDASEMASGVYFYKLDTDRFTDTKKMVLLK